MNCYYYRHYSFWKDIEMIFATVLGFKVKWIANYEELKAHVAETGHFCNKHHRLNLEESANYISSNSR